VFDTRLDIGSMVPIVLLVLLSLSCSRVTRLFMHPNGTCRNDNFTNPCCLTVLTSCSDFQTIGTTIFLLDPTYRSTYTPSDTFHIIAESGTYTREGTAPTQDDWFAYFQTHTSVTLEGAGDGAHFLYNDSFWGHNGVLSIL
jgi:hypothetical protein